MTHRSSSNASEAISIVVHATRVIDEKVGFDVGEAEAVREPQVGSDVR
jgi:hypothetical protein